MRGAARLWLVITSMLMASPLLAQSVGQLPGEDRSSGSVPPAPPPERRYAPPPFPKFSPTPPKSRHIRVAPKPKVSAKAAPTAKSKRVTLREEKRTKVRKDVAVKQQRLTSREIKDRRWCGTLTKKQLARNAKCRKVLDKQEAAKRVTKPSPTVLTKADRKDELRCGKLSLNQILRDARCRRVAERHLAGEPKQKISKAKSNRTKAKAATKATGKSRTSKKRARR